MSKTIVLEQELPSYLGEFFEEHTKCRLIYGQPFNTGPHKLKEDSFELNTPEEENEHTITDENVFDFIQRKCNEGKNEEAIVEGLLKVDLDEGSIDVVGKSPQQKYCSIVQPTTEEFHYPLEMREARSLLGIQYNGASSDTPTFCIIKDTNKKNMGKQVILGGQKSSNSAISYSGYSFGLQLAEGDSLKWDRWKETVRFQPNATEEYTFRRIYNIYGTEIKENVDIGENIASMILETSWNKPVEDEPDFIETGLNLKMQLVSGHPNSFIHGLWLELKQLEKFMGVLNNENALEIGSTVISDTFLPASDLAENIHYLCSNPIRKRKHTPLKLLAHDLRELTILDRLWCLLIRCKDLIDLKNSLSTFFRIAKIENLVDRDRAVELVKDLDIQDYMLNLTLSESLKFLVAIGCEKLKNDYLAVVSFYNPMHQITLEKIWSKYCEAKKVDLKRKSMAPNQPKYFALTDPTFNKEKLDLLINLHEASEYVIFMKNNLKESIKLSDDNFRKISNEAYLKFVFNNERIRISEQLKTELISLTCDLDSRNEELYKNLDPERKIYEVKFKMNNNKLHKDESIYTIVMSKNCIFPKSIGEDPIVESGDDPKVPTEMEKGYYVAMLITTKYGFF